MKSEVYVTLQVEGEHQWKECPFEEVAYLRVLHRHVFHIKAFKEVTHTERDVEFIMFKHEIADYFKEKYYNETKKLHCFGNMSCEKICEELMDKFNLTRVEVSEDNENGSILEK